MNRVRSFGVTALVLGAALFLGATQANAQRASLEWEGSIDDRANLVIRGRSVRVQTVSGQANGRGRSNWGNWNARPQGRARVDKKDGRGKVRVVQQPSRWNNFTTIIRIEDLKGGRDNYRVRVEWN